MKTIIRFLLTITSSTLLLLLSHNQVYAKKLVFTDDFSHGLDNWTLVRGLDDMWSNDNQQLKIYVADPRTITEMVPSDTVWNNQWQNIEFTLDYTPLKGVDKNIAFNYQSSSNWYEIHFVSSFFQVQKVKKGAVVWSENVNYILNNGKTYHLVIIFNQGSIKLFVDDNLVFDLFDTTFTTRDYGKISLKAGTGLVFPTEVVFDNIAVYDLDQEETSQIMPLFKQSNQEWANDEYDSASDWSEKTKIKNWGCALTAVSMVLVKHGINILPDGQPLNPGTLNAWLKDQLDGYWGNGLINWMAVTRLTHEISAILGTPSLEYERLDNQNWLTNSIASIRNGNPAILEIPGHFMVAYDVTANQTDLLINDPAYVYTKFSQHQQQVVSVRLLKPSYTDLSYIGVAVNPNVMLKIITPTNEIVDVANAQYLKTPPDEESNLSESTPELKVIELPKPDLGRYQLLLSQIATSQQDIKIFTYNQDGEINDLSISAYVGPQPISYILEYTNNNPTLLSSSCNAGGL